MDDESARTQVVEAADRLFYEHGIRSVGMAQIRDASGVSLKRLYQLFPAKDLVAAAALHRARPRVPRRSARRTSRRCRHPRRGSSASSTSCTTGSRSPTSGAARSSTRTARRRPGRSPCSRSSRSRSGASRLPRRARPDAGRPADLGDQLLLLANGAMVTAAILHDPSLRPPRQARGRATPRRAGRVMHHRRRGNR